MKLNVDLTVVQMFRDNLGTCWTSEDDRRFWTRLRGRRGLNTMREDAKALERLCRQLSKDPTDLEFMRYRLRVLGICLRLSGCEDTARIIYRKLPHFFARFAAELFNEMLGRAELVIEERAPQLLESFGEPYGQATHTFAHRASAGSTASRASW